MSYTGLYRPASRRLLEHASTSLFYGRRGAGRYADFCNECGNCDTFCPEYGGPHVAKPSFHGIVESWGRAAPREGFVLKEKPEGGWIRGRINGRLYQVAYVHQAQQYLYDDGVTEVRLSG